MSKKNNNSGDNSSKIQVIVCGGTGCVSAGSLDIYDKLTERINKLDKNIEIKRVEILTYNATYGHQITSKNWLKQFLGFNGKQTLKYGKDIQAISGATISAKSITEDIKETVNQLETLKRQNE